MYIPLFVILVICFAVYCLGCALDEKPTSPQFNSDDDFYEWQAKQNIIRFQNRNHYE